MLYWCHGQQWKINTFFINDTSCAHIFCFAVFEFFLILFLKIAFHNVSLTVLLDCYTIYAVKQERFLQDFDKVPDKKWLNPLLPVWLSPPSLLSACVMLKCMKCIAQSTNCDRGKSPTLERYLSHIRGTCNVNIQT